MKTYVITISEKFPQTHKRKGEPTFFVERIEQGKKKHTIRGNYPLWAKRFESIEKGEACLSVRVWTGKPYASKQKEVFNFTNLNGIGIEKIEFNSLGWMYIGNDICNVSDLSNNDGLMLIDFKEWFKKADTSKDMVVIHFTDFRYHE